MTTHSPGIGYAYAYNFCNASGQNSINHDAITRIYYHAYVLFVVRFKGESKTGTITVLFA
jgi:hypothetical protein